jgi:hypothetical protein
MATAGLVLGYLGFAAAVLFVLIIVVMAGAAAAEVRAWASHLDVIACGWSRSAPRWIG